MSAGMAFALEVGRDPGVTCKMRQGESEVPGGYILTAWRFLLQWLKEG